MYCYETSKFKSDIMIFVGGLESNTTNRELLHYFGSFGAIRFCEVQTWKNNPSKCRGFAIMDVADYTTFENILLTPHRLNGRQIEVKKLINNKKELDEQTCDIQERKIFVSSLPKKLTDDELYEYFSQFGPVELAYIIKHHKDAKSKGFGFVCFCNKTTKQNALIMAQSGNLQINGKNIICSNYSLKDTIKDKKIQYSIEVESQDLYSSNSGNEQEKMKSAGNRSRRAIDHRSFAQMVGKENASYTIQYSPSQQSMSASSCGRSSKQLLDMSFPGHGHPEVDHSQALLVGLNQFKFNKSSYMPNIIDNSIHNVNIDTCDGQHPI